ncbi:hypothetical protein MMC07_008327 [Pseudocyphellaria aurata]|nr:hypothetical protein [Pseudocyphellaria aurata]
MATNQECCAYWEPLFGPSPSPGPGQGQQINERTGVAYWCVQMDPTEQCTRPLRKSRRFYPGGDEIPEKYDPDCPLIVNADIGKVEIGNVNVEMESSALLVPVESEAGGGDLVVENDEIARFA